MPAPLAASASAPADLRKIDLIRAVAYWRYGPVLPRKEIIRSQSNTYALSLAVDRSAYFTAPMPIASATSSSSAASNRAGASSFVQDAAGALHRFDEQVAELDVIAGPGAQPVAVGAEHQADLGVLEDRAVRYPARLPGHREDHPEVQRLVRADHVDRAVAVQFVDPVPDGGQVGGGVVVAAVALADDDGQRPALAAGEPGRERAQRTVAVAPRCPAPPARPPCRRACRCRSSRP